MIILKDLVDTGLFSIWTVDIGFFLGIDDVWLTPRID